MRAWLLVAIAGCGRVAFDPRADATSAVDTGDRPNRVFMSFAASLGDFGGLAGADARCQAYADNQTLGGTWRALLSTSLEPWPTRLAGSRGWVDLEGMPIADQPADFLGKTFNPVRVDERGQRFPTQQPAFFISEINGNCGRWTQATAEGAWTVYSDRALIPVIAAGTSCGDPHHIICVETGHVAAVKPDVQPGRLAFITAAGWQSGLGVTAADALCNIEGNSLREGSYRAWLATSAASAESRFSASGLPWVRPDGTRIVDDAADLVGPSPAAEWKSFVGQLTNGDFTGTWIWTGTQAANCTDWTSNVGGPLLPLGHAASARRSDLAATIGDCTGPWRLLCLEL